MEKTEKLTSDRQKQAEEIMQTSLQLLQLIMNNIPQAVFWKNRDLFYLGCNRAFAEDAGLSSPEDVIGKTDFDMPWKDQAELYRADDQRVLENGEPKLNYEESRTKPDGSTIWLSTSKIPVHENSQIVAVLGMYEDITARKQAEEAVKAEQQRSQTILESVTEAMIISRLSDSKVLYANQALAKIGNIDLETLIGGRTVDYFVNPADREKVVELLGKSGRVSDFETQLRRGDGSLYWALASARIIDYQNETCVLSSYVDITEQKQVEIALKESEEKFKAIADNTAVGLFIHQAGIIRYAGREFARLLGYDVSETIGRPIMDFLHPDEHQRIAEIVRKRTAGENAPDQYETRMLKKDGSALDVLMYNTLVEYEGQPATQGAFLDLTQRKHAEEAIKAEQQRSQTILESVRVPLLISRLSDKQVLYANQALAQVSHVSLDKLIGFPTSNFYADSDAQKTVIKNLQQHGYISDFEVQFRRTDGSLYWALLSSRILDYQGETCVFSSYVDITERKNLEQQLQTAFERRGRQVQLSTQVSQSIAAASSLEELYQRVVTQVKEQFGYYHTQILHFDAAQDAVVLVTGYGEIGAKMLAAGHRLPMGEGLIGTAASTGEIVLRPALENDPDWHPNPFLPDTKGEIAVPIKLGDNILGVLDVQSNVAGTLGADDQLLLEGLCGQIATGIGNTRLRQEMTEKLDEINRLYRAMSHEGWQAYRETANIPSAFMFDQGALMPASNLRLADELFANLPLTVPAGEMIGTLAIANDPQHPITPEDQNFLQQVSDQVALALESARLFEQTQVAYNQAEQRASQLETVANLSSTISSVLDPDSLLQSVVDFTKERFGIYHAHIYLANDSWQTLILSAGAGEVGRKMVAEEHAIEMGAEKSLVARAVRERQAVIVNDVQIDPGFLSNPLLPETRSEMAVPMIVGDKVLGVFDVQSDRLSGFSKEDANVYTTLASQVAVALQNARLYVEQAATMTQLRELDRLKNSFLANMSHELRTPLNSILGFTDVIMEGLDGPLTDNMSNDLQLINKNGQHLLHLINDVLDMAKITAGRMDLDPEKFKVHEILDEVASITSTLASEKNLALLIGPDSDQTVEIFADRTRLRQVMINLVNNAIKFTEKGQITIRIDRKGDAKILISVKDTGVGIQSDKLEVIFQEFTQVDTSSTRKAGGTGLGLPISRRLVVMHGGLLWAESTGIPGEGSTFFVELPLIANFTEVVEKKEK